MNQNTKRNLLKLAVIRRVLESRSSGSSRTMAWRATGANNESFVNELKGKITKLKIYDKF
jgi:hypothetical protein